MEPLPQSFRRWDLFGTLLASLILVAGSLVSLFGIHLLGASREMFSELGEQEMPLITKMIWQLHQAHLPELFALSLLLLGIVMLLKIPDRQRANLYAGLTGMLLGLSGGGLLAVALLPLVKIVSTMGSQT